MGNRRFSGTTWALIGMSLVALYFVGTKVTPPPAAPPKEAPPQTAVASAQTTPGAPAPAAQSDEKMSKDRAERMKQIAADMKKNPKPTTATKKFNPTQIDVETQYWQQNRDGQTGVDQMRAKVTKAEEEQNKSTGPAAKALPGKLQPETPNSATSGTAPSK